MKYYMQDTRQIVGNNVMWWAKDHKGYTYNIENAHVFTEQEAFEIYQRRGSDKPWPKHYVDSKTTLIVDCQHLEYELAMPKVTLRRMKGGQDDS